MSEPPTETPGPDGARLRDRRSVARGAGVAFLGRLGALMEAVSVPVFAWLYGGATFGLYAVLWSYVRVATAFTDFAMSTSLQRFVPSSQDEQRVHQVLAVALAVSVGLASTVAVALFLAAPLLAPLVNAQEADAERLVTVIRIYVWVLPFWTMVEVGTAAIRARRAFGPEIRVRIFYEQGLRLAFGVAFAVAGLMTYGLFLAHLISVALSAALALRLVARHYSLGRLARVRGLGPVGREMLAFAAPMTPANVIKFLNSELPVMVLNALLPGAAGAAAAAYYTVARKVTSALNIVRVSFNYVMAPLASHKKGLDDTAALIDMFAFATRLSVALTVPLATFIVAVRYDILAVLAPEFAAAAVAIVVLSAGRTVEALAGPAATMIEMLGHRTLPLVNGLAGVAALVALQVTLTPGYGVAGAAVAAAAALNVVAYLSLVQARAVYRLWPYSLDMARPLVVAVVTSAGIAGITLAADPLGPAASLFLATIGLMLALIVLVRYGFTGEDAALMGSFGRVLPLPRRLSRQTVGDESAGR